MGKQTHNEVLLCSAYKPRDDGFVQSLLSKEGGEAECGDGEMDLILFV